MRKRRDRRFRYGIAAPVRTRLLAAAVEREHDAAIGGAREQRHHDAREAHWRRDVDAQQGEPVVERLMLERAERAEQGSGVHERIEPSELRVERACDVCEVGN